MSIDTVTQKIKQEIDSGELKLTAIFAKHLLDLQRLNAEGYSYKTIYEKIGCELTFGHFKNLIFNARKKHQENNEVPRPITDTASVHEENKPEPKMNDEVPIKDYTHDEWLEVGIRTERIIEKLETANLSPKEVKQWGCANELQVSKRLTEFKLKQDKAR